MADIDLKTLTPDTSIADSAVLFGADSQASTTPSVYSVATLRTHIVGTANTFTQPQVVSVNSSSDALRITQTGAGNALVVEDSANPDSSPFIVAANGDVLAGRTTSGIGAKLEVQNDTTNAHIAAFAVSDTIRPTTINVRFRAGATAVQSGDVLGINQFRGFDGASTIIASQISSEVDGTPGTNDMPGRLVFSTTADGASSPTERMRITSGGFVGINNTNPSAVLNVTGHNDFSLGLTAQTSSAQTAMLSQPVAVFLNTSTAAGNGMGLRFNIADTGGTARTVAGLGAVATTKTASTVTGDMYFYTGSTERMRITSGGNAIFGGSANYSGRLTVIPASTPTTVADAKQIQIGEATENTAYRMQIGYLVPTAQPWAGSIQVYENGNPTNLVLNGAGGNVGVGTTSPQARLDVAGRIWSTPPAGGLAGMSMYTAAASGFVPGQIAFTRASATGGATPNNSAVGEFRFDGRDANGSYTVFAQISAEMFTNAAGGAPGSMSFLISASGASAQERMRLTASGLGIGSTTFGTSAERVLSIGTGVAPTTGPADTIQIYSTDLSAGNTILSLFTEGTPVNANTTAAATHRIAVRINGTVYYLLANTAA